MLPDFTIKRLGEAAIKSPMKLSHVMDDLIANFVEDHDRVLYYRSLKKTNECIQQRIPLPSFEAAGPRDRIFFDPARVKAAIVTCGGLCPGLNDVIQSIVHSLRFHYGVKTILGIQYGYQGLVENSEFPPIELTPELVENIHTSGGSILGSSRGPQPVAGIVDFLVNHGINILFTIGGDGTQRGALAIVNEIEARGLKISVVGVPKTIDNDIMYVERSFGFQTAYSVAATALLGAHSEARGYQNGIAIVKLMGRHSGSLSAHATIASGDVNFCLIPEIPFDLDPPNGFLPALEKRILTRQHAVVVVAEGAGQNLIEDQSTPQYDASGNLKLEDIGLFLKNKIEEYFYKKQIPISVKYIDPSYLVRSLRTHPSDRMYCMQLAHDAVHAAMSGRTGMIVGHWNSAFTHVPIQAATSRSKTLDPESDVWLSVLETTGQPNRMKNNL